MTRDHKILVGKFAAVGMIVPALIFAYSSGPPVRHTGAPGDSLCTECHLGTANSGPGKVEVTFPAGLAYSPAVKQRWIVTVTGNEPTVRLQGFELTVRPASNLSNGQAGTLTSVDANTQVLCENDSLRPPAGCPASAPLEFIEHTLTGTRGNTFTFDWTPPSIDVGPVQVYVAGNAANGNGANTGDRIYTASYTLAPASAQPLKPAIRSSQPVLQAFSGQAGLSAGTWLEIYGANLSSTTREWGGADFQGNRAPTLLDGVGVNINGKPAFVRYVSPAQINVQAPDDDAVGPVRIEVTGPNGVSDPVTVPKTAASPALLTTPAFNVDSKQYVAALYSDFATFVGRTGLIAGVPFRPAKPGDTIVIFAVGCGATDPPSPAGQFFSDARPLASPVQVRFGDVVAQAQAFLAANAVGLCQFNVTVPDIADGDARLDVTVGGVATGQTLYATIQR